MNSQHYEIAIVGSGAGGATLAKELSRMGRRIAVIEQGKWTEQLGNFRSSIWHYDMTKLKTPRKSKEGVYIWRSLMAGGSTVFSCGNGIRLKKDNMLSRFGIDIEPEMKETERELNVQAISPDLLSEGSLKILSVAKKSKYKMQLMPKFIQSQTCRRCGQCIFGCQFGAKWSAVNYLRDARKNGATVLYNTKIISVLTDTGKRGFRKVKGVITTNGEEILADTVILASGAISTPIILQRSGLREAGSNLFVDLFINTYGVTNGINLINEPPMALLDAEFQEDGFILSTYATMSPVIRFIELGYRSLGLRSKNLLGIMTKIADEGNGRVFSNGAISKKVTPRDQHRLDEGMRHSKILLKKCGAHSLLISKPMGAHPGGTAAIGKIVNTDLQTKVSGLFVCDASVLPESPGVPPILTIVSLAKRLARNFA
jgi:choline dehydrogenase-like flavoprotein